MDWSALSTAPTGNWSLALNVDTSDGNVVSYHNADFWESASATGGATTDAAQAFSRDFKDPTVFTGVTARSVLVVVHHEGAVLGWRTWELLQEATLAESFASINKCSSDNLVGNTGVQLASESTGGDKGSLIDREPLVHNYDDNSHLYLNWCTGDFGGRDCNRLTTKRDLTVHNDGWGLGTLYDAGFDAGSSFVTGNACKFTMRPECDAQLHSEPHWKSGMIGSDHLCHSGCPWTEASNYDYDYAIFVQDEGQTSGPPTSVTAFGDPHLNNIKKESFEVRQPGLHRLLNVPLDASATDALLRVDASMERVEPGCSPLFIRHLDIMGQWLHSLPPLGLSAGAAPPGDAVGDVFQVGNSSALGIEEFVSVVPSDMVRLTLPSKEISAPSAINKHTTLLTATFTVGPGVNMKVSWTLERTPTASLARSLWVSVTGLSTVREAIGGLLGLDDHLHASAPDGRCAPEGEGGFLLSLPPGGAAAATASLE